MVQWEVLLLAAEVPLADTSRGIPGRLQRLRQRDLGILEAACRSGRQDSRQPGTDGQPPREQRDAARRTHRRRRVALREAHAFEGHAVQIRSSNGGMAVTAEVAPAEVVGEDHDDVRKSGGGWRRKL